MLALWLLDRLWSAMLCSSFSCCCAAPVQLFVAAVRVQLFSATLLLLSAAAVAAAAATVLQCRETNTLTSPLLIAEI